MKNFIDQQNLQVKTSKNYSSLPVKVTGQDLYNLQPNYTYNNNTDFNNTNPILSANEDRMGYERYFMEQLNIEALKQDYPYDSEMIDGIMDIKKEQDEVKEALGSEYTDYNLVMATTFGLPINDSYIRDQMQMYMIH